MTAHEIQRGADSILTDKIGKVFRAVFIDGILYRRCLGCDEVLTREGAREHAEVFCCPTKRSNTEAHEEN